MFYKDVTKRPTLDYSGRVLSTTFRPFGKQTHGNLESIFLRSTLGERFVIFGDPVVDGIPVHARREDSRFLVTWTGDVQNLRHFE